jgi:hypothetical protein
MPDPTSGQPIDLPRLREQIRALFSDSELRDLCMDLGVDFENLPGAAKGDKARELILYMERQARLPDLIRRVIALRPHIGLNIQALAEEITAVDPRRGAGLTSLVEQFQRYNQQMVEWKELHRQMNFLLTVFDPFRKQVERFDARPERFDFGTLEASWQTVHLFIGQLLRWAMTISLIGPRYREAGSELSGVEWAVRLGTIDSGIRRHLSERPPRPTSNPDDVWWRRLREETSELEDAIKQTLFLADEELRKTAADLFDLSAESLWRSS